MVFTIVIIYLIHYMKNLSEKTLCLSVMTPEEKRLAQRNFQGVSNTCYRKFELSINSYLPFNLVFKFIGYT